MIAGSVEFVGVADYIAQNASVQKGVIVVVRCGRCILACRFTNDGM